MYLRMKVSILHLIKIWISCCAHKLSCQFVSDWARVLFCRFRESRHDVTHVRPQINITFYNIGLHIPSLRDILSSIARYVSDGALAREPDTRKI